MQIAHLFDVGFVGTDTTLCASKRTVGPRLPVPCTMPRFGVPPKTQSVLQNSPVSSGCLVSASGLRPKAFGLPLSPLGQWIRSSAGDFRTRKNAKVPGGHFSLCETAGDFPKKISRWRWKAFPYIYYIVQTRFHLNKLARGHTRPNSCFFCRCAVI